VGFAEVFPGTLGALPVVGARKTSILPIPLQGRPAAQNQLANRGSQLQDDVLVSSLRSCWENLRVAILERWLASQRVMVPTGACVRRLATLMPLSHALQARLLRQHWRDLETAPMAPLFGQPEV